MSAGRGYTAGMKPLALVPFVVLALAGCGNKGPLVHPQSPADEMAVPATTATPGSTVLPMPASTAPAAPAEATAPAPASTAPATPVEPTPAPPADGGG